MNRKLLALLLTLMALLLSAPSASAGPKAPARATNAFVGAAYTSTNYYHGGGTRYALYLYNYEGLCNSSGYTSPIPRTMHSAYLLNEYKGPFWGEPYGCNYMTFYTGQPGTQAYKTCASGFSPFPALPAACYANGGMTRVRMRFDNRQPWPS